MILRTSILSIAVLLMSSTILISCGGSTTSKEKIIKAKNISVSGEGSSYFKVVDGDYILKVVDGKIVIPIKLELTQKYNGKKTELGNLSLVPLDNTGAAVPNIGLDMHPATVSEWAKVSDLIKGEVGKSTTVSFQWNYFSNKEMIERIMNESESFELTRADFTGGSASNTTENNSDEVSSSQTGNQDWDKLIADYDDYVSQYLDLLKKAKNKDMSALGDYPAMLEKAQALDKELKGAQGKNSLNAEQLKKMFKIEQKMLNAAIEIQKK